VEDGFMSGESRRRFLRQLAVAGAAAAVRPLDLLASGRAMATETGSQSAEVAMSIARWGGEPLPDQELTRVATRLTEDAMTAIGGMGRFVNSGDVVWVKPNIGWNRAAKLAANTNPDVVATLVRLCLEAGAKKVKIGDNSCNKAKQCYKRSGIAEAAKAAGAELVYLDEKRFKRVELGGQRLDAWEVYPEALEADLLINVPIAKHHGLSRVSLAMKNYMGLIGGRRASWHQDLPACLCDITAYMKPRLCVLDAVRVLTDHGPQGGNTADVKRLDTVAASTDIVALDALGAELLGHQPAEIATVKAGHDCGLGTLDYRELELRELEVS
jgi:uncharacterized protein (DUF362 family)